MKKHLKIRLELDDMDAIIFDMDGVITDTASIHAAAWKQLFDEYLEKVADQKSESFEPFDVNSDYLLYVDGKPRYEGVKSFLESRNIELPFGDMTTRLTEKPFADWGTRKTWNSRRCFAGKDLTFSRPP